jgi:uncharacterized protein YjiS (DUF1127 family)
MSTISSAPAATQGRTGQSFMGGLGAILKSWWMAYITWRIEQAAIAQLSSLSDRELKDIGLTRCEITSAVRLEVGDRPFGRHYRATLL